MDSDSDSSSNNEEPKAKRKINFRINFDIDNFEETFRVSRATAEQILRDINVRLQHETTMNRALTPEQQLLTTIRFFASNAFYNVIGHAHLMNQSTVWRVIHRTVKAINDDYFRTIICWPTEENKRNLISQLFFEHGGMPCV